MLDFEDTHNAFWWVTLNVNNNFGLFTRELHMTHLTGTKSLQEDWQIVWTDFDAVFHSVFGNNIYI